MNELPFVTPEDLEGKTVFNNWPEAVVWLSNRVKELEDRLMTQPRVYKLDYIDAESVRLTPDD